MRNTMLCKYWCIFASFDLVFASSPTISNQLEFWTFDAGLESDEDRLQSYLNIDVLNYSIPLQSIGICLRLLLDDLFLQCVFEEDDFKLEFLENDREYGFLRLHGYFYMFQFPNSQYIVPEQWYHLCVSYEQKTKHMAEIKMFLDGIPLIYKNIETTNAPYILNLKPTWKLGLCKTSVQAINLQTFRGSLSDLNVWSRPLKDDEMKRFTLECLHSDAGDNAYPDIIRWSTVTVATKGIYVTQHYRELQCQTKCELKNTISTTKNDQCCEEDKITLTFPTRVNLKNAMLTCAQLGGTMPLPRSNTELGTLSKSLNEKMVGTEETCRTTWMPLHGDKWIEESDDYSWKYYSIYPHEGRERENVTFSPWQIGQPNGAGYQKCVAMPLNLTVDGVLKYFYYDVVCKETHCFYCQVCPKLYFILRGLPERWAKIDDNEEGIDSNYIYVPEFQHMEGIVLEGYYDHTIWKNKQTQNWEIVNWDTDPPNIVALLNTKSSYPFGMNVWKFKDDTKANQMSVNFSVADDLVLKLSMCTPETQFTCNDGTCIPLKNRCDEKTDCVDKSDEKHCDVVFLDTANYRKEYAPSSKEKTTPLDVVISLDVSMLSEFSEVDLSYKIKFLLSVQWFDDRLLFKNLKDNRFKNIIDYQTKQVLWTPPLIFNNSEKTTMVAIKRPADEPTVNIFVQKSVSFEVASPSYLHEAYLYKGCENPLVLRTEYNLKLSCIYELAYYPFDTQVCTMQIKSIASAMDKINLLAGDVSYLGPTSLLELDVKNVSMSAKGPDYILVEITLKRKCYYHIATTYFPILCLLIIVELLLFMPEGHFEATIMVALTTMLVMYTLHQSIISTLPKTSYMKMIDIWLLSALTIPFMVFLNEVFSETKRYLNQKVSLNSSLSEKDGEKDKPLFHVLSKSYPGFVKDQNAGKRSIVLEDGNAKTNRETTEKMLVTHDNKLTTAKCFIANSKIIIPLITVIFIVVYMVIAIIHYL